MKAVQEKGILILKSNARAHAKVETYLRGRKWEVLSFVEVRDVISHMIDAAEVPKYALVCIDHPQKQAAVLPSILRDRFGIKLIAYFDKSAADGQQQLEKLGIGYSVSGLPSGPSVERIISRMSLDEERQAREQKGAAPRKSKEDGGGDDVISVKGGDLKRKEAGYERREVSEFKSIECLSPEDENKKVPLIFMERTHGLSIDKPQERKRWRPEDSDAPGLRARESADALLDQFGAQAAQASRESDLGEARPTAQSQTSQSEPKAPTASTSGPPPGNGATHQQDAAPAAPPLLPQEGRPAAAIPQPELPRATDAFDAMEEANRAREAAEKAKAKTEAREAAEKNSKSAKSPEFSPNATQDPDKASSEKDRDKGVVQFGEARTKKTNAPSEKAKPKSKNALGRVIEESLLKMPGVDLRNDLQGTGLTTVIYGLILAAPEFTGYLVAHSEKDLGQLTLDNGEDFLSMLSTHVYEGLGVNGMISRYHGSFFVAQVAEFNFADWAADRAKLLIVGEAAENQAPVEIAFSFYPYAQAAQLPRPDQGFYRFNVSELAGDRHLDFGLFLYLSTNQKFFLYTRESRILYEKQIERLRARGISDFFVREDN